MLTWLKVSSPAIEGSSITKECDCSCASKGESFRCYKNLLSLYGFPQN
jgi:hypothetical protein